MSDVLPPQRVVVCFNPAVNGAGELARALATQTEAAGRAVWLGALPDPHEGDPAEFRGHLSDADLLVCVGGDGTVLHASEHAAATGTPVFGVRMGRLGFLSEVTGGEASLALDRVLAGAGRFERRSTVRAQVNGEAPSFALNDIVIGRASLGRTISVGARVDGVLLAEYRADAVIVATATGSTGYALSVSGPILPPESLEMILVPVAPHLTRSNALVLPPSSEISLYVERGYEAVFTVDGLRERPLDSGTTVVIGHGERHVDFVRLGEPAQFYANIAERLGWLRSDHVLDAPDA
ncbi:MAG: NAD(+)/NADH kinase [Chloroflexi bacterium]|nr:NAD(+)/NADH kinase [Chloroflexota bacterium]MDA1145710.1 NAD(+)/NADH kinase [Chloroflexota bacterium]